MAIEELAEAAVLTPTIEEGRRLLAAFILIESEAERERLIAMAEAMLWRQSHQWDAALKH